MAKKKKPRKKKPTKIFTPSPSPARYEHYFLVLEGGEVNSHQNQTVYFDLAPGERPDKVLAEMRHVAKKEKIPVQIEKVSSRSLLLFYFSEEKKPDVRVRRGDEVIAYHVTPAEE